MSTLPVSFSRTNNVIDEVAPMPAQAPTTGRGQDLTLTDFTRLLRRWWWLALLVWVTVVAAFAAFTATQPTLYSADTTVLIRTEASDQLFPLGGDEIQGRTMAAEADFLGSSTFLDAAHEAAGNDDRVDIDVGDIAGRVVPSTIGFEAISPTPDRAVETAEAWAATYIELRHQIDLDDIEATISTLEATQEALTEERSRVAEPITRIDAQIQRTTDPAAASTLSVQRVALVQTLNAQLQPIDTQLATVTSSLAVANLTAGILADPEVSARVNSHAETPTTPSSPRTLRNLALGVVVGTMLALAAVMTVASFDDRLRTVDDVEAATGLGNLAAVPFNRSRKKPIELPPGSAMEEAFQRIVSAIDFAAAAGREHKVLLVTSPRPSEGKTSTTARLAMALASQNRNVLVIDADLRRPALSAALGAEPGPGLADYLGDEQMLVEAALHRVDWRPHLAIMPAGTVSDHRNPAELLRSQDLEALVNKMRDYCDHILIDSPPLLPVVDALELANVSDAVILSLYARKSRGRAAQRALRLLDEVGDAKLLGVVLNGVQRSDSSYDSYAYSYY